MPNNHLYSLLVVAFFLAIPLSVATQDAGLPGRFVVACVAGEGAVHEGDTLSGCNPSLADSIVGEARKYLGTPYRWGGKTPRGFDCAGFVRYVYSKFGLSLSASAPSQSHEGRRLQPGDLQPGDLVFYGGSRDSKSIGHVGLVTEVAPGEFKFIHASNTGVRVSSSKEPYYKSRYICACRVIDKVRQ